MAPALKPASPQPCLPGVGSWGCRLWPSVLDVPDLGLSPNPRGTWVILPSPALWSPGTRPPGCPSVTHDPSVPAGPLIRLGFVLGRGSPALSPGQGLGGRAVGLLSFHPSGSGSVAGGPERGLLSQGDVVAAPLRTFPEGREGRWVNTREGTFPSLPQVTRTQVVRSNLTSV